MTLRGARMYEFLDRLVSIALPRIRDFRGLSPRSFDGRGNYSIGLREQIIFPEIDYDDVAQIRGLDVTITTTAKTDDRRARSCAGSGSRSHEKNKERDLMAKKSMIAKAARPTKHKTQATAAATAAAGRAPSTGSSASAGSACASSRTRAYPGHDEGAPGRGSHMLTDPIADMLARIRNANKALHDTVEMPTSRAKVEIARLLKEEGYIRDFRVDEGESFKLPRHRAEVRTQPRAHHHRAQADLEAGRRIYARKDRLPRVLGGMGTADPVHLERRHDEPYSRAEGHRRRGYLLRLVTEA